MACGFLFSQHVPGQQRWVEKPRERWVEKPRKRWVGKPRPYVEFGVFLFGFAVIYCENHTLYM